MAKRFLLLAHTILCWFTRTAAAVAAAENCSGRRGGESVSVAAAAAAVPLPRGHLQPFGAWRPGIRVETLVASPDGRLPLRPREFFDRYCSADGGAGRPVLLRRAARNMPAMHWSDERLMTKYGSAAVDPIEIGLKESRTEFIRGPFRLDSFLRVYNRSDIHLVSEIPRAMQRDVDVLPFLQCGGFHNFLGTHKLWMGRGGSRSVVHKDDAENVHCLFAGRKRFALVHPRWRDKLEAHPNQPSPIDRFGFVDTNLDSSLPGYGEFFGRLDVDAMDLVRYPGWRDVEWYVAEVGAGDCIYIPHGWYHQVRAGPSRTVGALVWFWRPEQFDAATCARSGPPRRGLRFSDCSFGYVPEFGGPPRGRKGGGSSVTRCSHRGQHHARRPLRGEL